MKRHLYLMLAFSLLFSFQIDAQKKKKPPKPKYEAHIGLGYFNHGKIFPNSEINFSGFNTINLGYAKRTTSKIFQAELQFFNVSSVNNSSNTLRDETKNALNISSSSLYSLTQVKTSQLFWGWFYGVLLEKASSEPQVSFSFPTTEAKIGVFTGLELKYLHSFTKMSLFADLKLGLIDTGFSVGKSEDPRLPPDSQIKYEQPHFIFKPRSTLTFGVTFPLKN
jgi:hypothetical protein